MVAGLVVVAGRVVTLEGVTTVRVTVLCGWVVVAGRVVVVVVAGLETLVLLEDVGVVVLVVGREVLFVAGTSVLEVVAVVLVGLLVAVLPVVGVVLEEVGCMLMFDGLASEAVLLKSAREPVTTGLLVLPPPLSKELPVPVVPVARFS